MGHITYRMVLTGARTGQTCRLGNTGQFHFTDGVGTMSGDSEALAGLVAYLGKCYQAFPEGTKELEDAQKANRENPELVEYLKERGVSLEVPSGTDKVQTDPQQNGQPVVSGGVPANDSGAAQVPPVVGSESAAGGSGASGSVPGGDGHANAGMDRTEEEYTRIREAVTKLDKANGEHWTQDGQPRVDVVAEFSGLVDVKRADIVYVAPDAVRE